MEIRIFQIVVPLIALFFIFGAIFHYHKSKITIYETALRVAFWLDALLVPASLAPFAFPKQNRLKNKQRRAITAVEYIRVLLLSGWGFFIIIFPPAPQW